MSYYIVVVGDYIKWGGGDIEEAKIKRDELRSKNGNDPRPSKQVVLFKRIDSAE